MDVVGNSLVYIERDGVITRVNAEYVETLVARYWHEVSVASDTGVYLGSMAHDDTVKIRKLWMVTAKAKPNSFPIVVWKGDPRPAHRRLPFDPLPIDFDGLSFAAPCFYELMGRTTNRKALMAWIGSLFDEKSQRQQYVWLHGAGSNGKSSLVRVLQDILGEAASSESVPDRANRFWTSGLLGKRLVYFPDCNNASFVTSGDFKQLTGEDPIRCEIKREAVFTAILPAKYLFLSNNKPRIGGTEADRRRVIFCHMGPVPKDAVKENYEDHLRREAPAFLSACWHEYVTMSKGNPRTVYQTDNPNEVNELVAETEHEFDAFVSQWVTVLADNPFIPDNQKSRVTTGQMRDVMIQAGYRTEFERRQLRDYMQRLGIVNKLVKVEDGSVIRVWLNVKILKRD